MGTMKGVKEDEKSLRPMFPRLHVNDTDKGGPRAPPRNKMALYEQLSILSQRFSSANQLPPHRPHISTLPASSSQGEAHERTEYASFYHPHSTSTPLAEKPYSRSFDRKNVKARGLESERTSTGCVHYKSSHAAGAEGSSFNACDPLSGTNSYKVIDDDDDDDFRVPTFVHSEIASHSKDMPVVEVPSSAGKPIHEAIASGMMSKTNQKIHGEQETTNAVVCKEHEEEFPINPEAGEKLADLLKVSLEASNQCAEINMRSLEKAVCQSTTIGKESSNSGSIEWFRSLNDMEFLENSTPSNMRNGPYSGASLGNSCRSCGDKENGPRMLKDADRSDEMSENSMIDSISELEISPDDVVEVIGLKQFWKARRAIVNQQTVFAIQVFELHRLIKVQKLFAASPDILLNDSHIINLQPKVVIKSLPVASSLKLLQAVQQGDDSSLKPSESADPLIVKAADPQTQERGSAEELCQLPRYVPHSGNPPPVPMPAKRPNPWCFHPTANHWLIPVMSPSEGLVYKPYAGPCPPTAGFMPPLYGNCVPLSLPSVAGDLMNTAFVFPESRQQQNMSVLPGSPAIGPNYFPAPTGILDVNQVISASAVEHVSPLTNARPDGRTSQLSRSSCSKSITRSEVFSGCLLKHDASKDSELHGSTASSPYDGAQREGRVLLPSFSVAPAAEVSYQPSHSSGREHQTNVIKVVPHNARSATESAERIFRSIQKERQQLKL